MSDPTPATPPDAPATPITPGTVAEWLSLTAGLAQMGKTKDALGALYAGVDELAKLVEQLTARVIQLELARNANPTP